MSSFPTGRRFLFPQINEEERSQLILQQKEPEAKRYAGAGGREKKGLRREKLRFPMLLHAQRDAPTSGCFTPNPT